MGAAGVHSIDQLHFITGQKITKVNAITQTFIKEKPMHPKDRPKDMKEEDVPLLPCTAEEYVAAQFTCEFGAVGTLTLTGVMSGQGAGVTYWNGTKGSAKLDGGKFTVFDPNGKPVEAYGAEDSRLPDELRKAAGNHAGAPALGTYNIALQMKAFIEGGGGGNELDGACSFDDALYNQRVIGAIHDSAAGGRSSRL